MRASRRPLYRSRSSFIDAAREHGVESLRGPFVTSGTRFDTCLEGMECTSLDTDKGSVVCQLEVTEPLANAFGTLHGGATSTLVDVAGTMALLALDPTRPGVSVELSTTFVAAAKLGEACLAHVPTLFPTPSFLNLRACALTGERIVVTGNVLKTGRMLGFTEVTIIRKDDEKLLATGKHTKAFGGASKPKPES